jgi:hypothetical protein
MESSLPNTFLFVLVSQGGEIYVTKINDFGAFKKSKTAKSSK